MFSFFKKSLEENFWKWFLKNEKYIYENVENLKINEKIFDNISDYITKVDKNLVFEFSPINENGIRDFAISADGIKESFPAVEKLIKLSPKIKNWTFSAFRQRTPGDDIEIKLGKYSFGYSDIFYKNLTKDNQLNIELHIKNYDDSPEMKNATYILLDGLLGEYDVEMGINGIAWKKLNEDEVLDLEKIIKLRELIDSRKI